MTNRFPFTRRSHYDVADNTITLFYHHRGAKAFDAELCRIIHGFIEDIPPSPALFRLINEEAWTLVVKHFPKKDREGCLQATFGLEDSEVAKGNMAHFDARAKALIEGLRELFIEEMPKLIEAGKIESEKRDEMMKNLSYWKENEEF